MKHIDNIFCATSDVAGIHFKVFASTKGIRKLSINDKEACVENANLMPLHFEDPYFHHIFRELGEYFDSKRKKFDVPLDLKGTEFQIKVWHELKKIPFGTTISYAELAERLGDVKYVRAVGRANGSNPVPIIIPCHRVINSNGNLGGYSAGLNIKEKLLELEGSLSLHLF